MSDHTDPDGQASMPNSQLGMDNLQTFSNDTRYMAAKVKVEPRESPDSAQPFQFRSPNTAPERDGGRDDNGISRQEQEGKGRRRRTREMNDIPMERGQRSIAPQQFEHLVQQPPAAHPHTEKNLNSETPQFAKEEMLGFHQNYGLYGAFDFSYGPMPGQGFQFALPTMDMYAQPPVPHALCYGQHSGQDPNAMYGLNNMHPHHPGYYGQMPDPYPQDFRPSNAYQGYGQPTAQYVSANAAGKRKVMGEQKKLSEGSTAGKSKTVRSSSEHFEDDESNDSDDVPLMRRAQRHHPNISRFSVSDTLLGHASTLAAPGPPAYKQQRTGLDAASHLKAVGSSDKDPMHRAFKPDLRPQPLTRPLPDPNAQAGRGSDAGDADKQISFKLPTYAVESGTTKDGYPAAKISLPGLVREVILLSPDHATQELHLFTQLFLPGQKALETPDPEPILAVLNFHTVCGIILDAYDTFELGDLQTDYVVHPHRPHHYRHDRYYDDEEEDNVDEIENAEKSAKDIIPDDIFFAAIDRWRAGSYGPAPKQSYELIRGVQEFCDIALDVIFFVHEHGLLRETGRDRKTRKDGRVRKERCDKGIKRGPRGGSGGVSPKRRGLAEVQDQGGDGVADEGEGAVAETVTTAAAEKTLARSSMAEEGKSQMKGTTARINTLQPRKKAKTDEQAAKEKDKDKDKPKAKPKPKPKLNQKPRPRSDKMKITVVEKTGGW